jgi:uncharacterized protein (TIGR02300 family)
VAVVDRGTKRRCSACGAPFYDLNKDPVICPKCHSPYVAAARVPVRALRGRAQELPPVAETAETSHFDEDEVLEHVDEDEDGLPPENNDQDGREDEELRD